VTIDEMKTNLDGNSFFLQAAMDVHAYTLPAITT
jgi:hypothetical protein